MADDSIAVICGPTAAGKSALAMSLARHAPIAVLSADSRQIYRGFDIGTAKPGAAERGAIPYYGIDVVSADQRYSASAWAEAARGWIAEARSAGRTPVIVGGTGFYIRALFEPLFREPVLDAVHRERLAEYLDSLPTPELRRWCVALDPLRSALGRTQLLRAVEIALLTGERVSGLHVKASRAASYSARYLLVDPGKPLALRIEARVRAMVEQGWLDEVQALATHVPPSAPAWNATGYREMHRWAQGEIGSEDAIGRVVIATRQYAKRQRTWFRHQLPAESVKTVNPDDPDVADVVRAWWDEGRSAA